MGFALESRGEKPPEWPHIICVGDAGLVGRGWAWHENPARRKCFVAEVAAPADLVADAVCGRNLVGVDRLLACVRLNQESHQAMLRIFARFCRACEGNHRFRAQRNIGAFRFIHADAIEPLRVACVPEGCLREPLFHHDGFRLPEDPKEVKKLLSNPKHAAKVKRLLRYANNIPVWVGDKERTRAAQIAYARQYAVRKGVAHGFEMANPNPL